MTRRLFALLLAALLLAGALLPAAQAAPDSGLEYWIGVDVVNQRTTVYRAADNSVVCRWICSTGKGGSTPVGTFYLSKMRRGDERTEWYWISKYKCYVKFAVRIKGSILFHSLPYLGKSETALDPVALAQLGTPASHGCVRLQAPASRWIAEHCPVGTKVIIHKGTGDSRITDALGTEAQTEITESYPDPPIIRQLTLEPSGSVDLPVGGTLQLNCVVTPADLPAELTWKSSKPRFASVDAEGRLTGLARGTTVVSVAAPNGISDKVTVNVFDPNWVTALRLNVSGKVTLPVGQTLQLEAEVTPDTAHPQLAWASSSKKRATVDDSGLVTALAEGSARITVRAPNGRKASVTVKVVDPYKPTGVALKPSGTAVLAVGETLQLEAELFPETAKTELRWTSSSKKRATVDDSGLVTALAPGSAKITVRTANGKKAVLRLKIVAASPE